MASLKEFLPWFRGWLAIAIAIGLGSVALIAVALLILVDDSPQAGNLRFSNSPFPNIDAANSRRTDGPIHAGSVGDLEAAWTVPLASGSGTEGSAAVPVAAAGVAYLQDFESNVQAFDLAGGEVLWEKEYGSELARRNGVVVAEGRVYGSNGQGAFALDRQTGEEIWSVRLVEDDFSQVSMAPGYRDGLVYFSTVPAAANGGEVGVLWALDARSGRKVWSFDTVPRGLWGDPDVNFGGGVMAPPAFDDAGSMYFGVAGPGPVPGTLRYPWGSSRPGPNLYTGSVVKLDAKTGKLQWYYQVTPHAICNWHMTSTVLAKAGGRDLVIGSGLAGIVVALDRRTGELVWKRAVGRHNGHDEDGLHAMRGEYSKLKTPMTVYPGALGGVYGSPSTNGKTIFLPVVNLAYRLFSQSQATPGGPISGELVALDVATGDLEWKLAFSSPPVGATTVVNDLVLTTTLDGTVHALGTERGGTIWTSQLPAGTNAGVTVSGGTLLAPASAPTERGEPAIVAYRLPS